jgi:membrane protease subunit (stomatin/prohibitin family)
LASGFSSYANGEDKSNRIQKIQADAAVLAKSLNEYLEKNFAWASKRGLALTNVAILGIEYDESTRDLLKTVQRADALTGTRGNSNLQASLAEGIVSAGQTEGSQGLFGLGIATGSLGVSGLFQQTSQSDSGSASTSGSQDLIAALEKLRVARMADLITEEEFQAAKAKLLGL